MTQSLPHCKHPCSDCPFKKDSPINNLGEARIKEILDASSFVCHKKHHLQCAGHMLLMKESNNFYRLAHALNYELALSGQELIYETPEDCIRSHSKS